ncbi:MAG: putative repeat protein (TIGR03806 family) [Saprospiraceae bacterium]|jgi:uncharacterized repeat protein (TIGR03806 family)
MKKQTLAILCLSAFLWTAFNSDTAVEKNYKKQLSEYAFFEGEMADLSPAEDLLPYALNAPLFSDYAEKLRFIRLPDGVKIDYRKDEVLEFPEGTQIIKTFYYTNDIRKPEKGRIILETRVLMKEDGEWTALPYVWNEEQTDAKLSVIGGKREVEWRDKNGKKQKINYSIPNKNQCKGCHGYDKKVRPIGPSARQLNGDFDYKSGTQNQLEHWRTMGIVENLPAKENIPQLADYTNKKAHSLDKRARAYLDANCAYCHNPHGAANTSGMFLHSTETDPAALGVNKSPIAAGRGSGGKKYGIAPGAPDESILLHRMNSTDPGVRMPEIGRQLIHTEGIELIEEWIAQMPSK